MLSPLASANTEQLLERCDYCSSIEMEKAAINAVKSIATEQVTTTNVLVYSLTNIDAKAYSIRSLKASEPGFHYIKTWVTETSLPENYLSDLVKVSAILYKLDGIEVTIPGSITGSALDLIASDTPGLANQVSNYIRNQSNIKSELDSFWELGYEAWQTLAGNASEVKACFSDGTCMNFKLQSVFLSANAFVPVLDSVSGNVSASTGGGQYPLTLDNNIASWIFNNFVLKCGYVNGALATCMLLPR